jgi:hypothetical protein
MLYLVDLFRFEHILHDLIVSDELVLVFRVHLYSDHWYIALSTKYLISVISNKPLISNMLTIDRIENLAVCPTCSALFDLGIVDLKQFIEPG